MKGIYGEEEEGKCNTNADNKKLNEKNGRKMTE